jgi:hypothetical protein
VKIKGKKIYHFVFHIFNICSRPRLFLVVLVENPVIFSTLSIVFSAEKANTGKNFTNFLQISSTFPSSSDEPNMVLMIGFLKNVLWLFIWYLFLFVGFQILLCQNNRRWAATNVAGH